MIWMALLNLRRRVLGRHKYNLSDAGVIHSLCNGKNDLAFNDCAFTSHKTHVVEWKIQKAAQDLVHELHRWRHLDSANYTSIWTKTMYNNQASHDLVGRLYPFRPISLLFYLFEIIYVKYFYLIGRTQQLYVLGFTIYKLFNNFGRNFLMNIDNVAEFAYFPIPFLSSLPSSFLLKLLSFSKLHSFSCF